MEADQEGEEVRLLRRLSGHDVRPSEKLGKDHPVAQARIGKSSETPWRTPSTIACAKLSIPAAYWKGDPDEMTVKAKLTDTPTGDPVAMATPMWRSCR